MSNDRVVQCSTCEFSDWYEYTSLACENCHMFNKWAKRSKPCQLILQSSLQEKESPEKAAALKGGK